jgi:uncharacterized repeat protein (TIGR03803 family)
MKSKNVLCGLTMAVVLHLGVLAGSAQSGAVFTSLYAFTGGTNGANPVAGLVQGSDGNFYGTTTSGSPQQYNENGTVFKISTNGVLTTLYAFDNFIPYFGADPTATLVQGSDGKFYGTTSYGGLASGVSVPGPGTVFSITTNGTLTSLYSFSGGFLNANPQGGLVQGSDGNFYGTTVNGGGYGTVFNITTNGTLTNLYSFTGTNDGANPEAALVQGSDGGFYGTTEVGGTNNLGTVFQLIIEPQLTMTVSGAFVNLSWPTNYPDWYLQKTVNLGAAGFVRIPLPGFPIIVNGQFVVTLPITSDQRGYYRLSSP